MMKKIWSFIRERSKESKKLNNQVYQSSLIANLSRIEITTKIAIPIHVLIIILYLLNINRNPALQGLSKWMIVIGHAIMLIFMVLILLSTNRVKRIPYLQKLIPYLLIFIISIILATGFLISIFDQYINQEIEYTPFAIVCLCVGAVFLLRPRTAILIFLFVFILLVIGLQFMPLSSGALAYSIANGLAIVGLGYALSTITWQGFCTQYIQKQKIEQQQRQLEMMAYHDRLTKLPNRYYFDEKISIELNKMNKNPHYQSCILVLDIDGFKQINDQYGHPVGDAILQQFTNVLLQHTSLTDTVARLGGEEFIILLPNTSLTVGRGIAENLRKAVMKEEFHADSHIVKLTTSIGISLLSPNHLNYYSLADSALYRAKCNGKNKVEVEEVSNPIDK